MTPAPLRIATRGSALARWQAEHVAGLLRAAHPGLDVALVVVETRGDKDRDRPIWQLGGQGVFVKEVQAAVLDGRADLAVHSAKDLPSHPDLQPDELVLAAVPERGDPRDVLVGARLDDIPPGGTVATGASRRRAQLADLRPDLTFAELRGNIDTRLAKAAQFSAVVMAAAALERLDRLDVVAQFLDVDLLLPQVAQGALAIECRADDAGTRDRLVALDDGPSRRAVDAERAFLAGLGGGCELPGGAHATLAPDGAVDLRAMLATLDGRVVLRVRDEGRAGEDPAAVGARLAERLLDSGGRQLVGDSDSVVPLRLLPPTASG